jgi:hypothetical protein
MTNDQAFSDDRRPKRGMQIGMQVPTTDDRRPRRAGIDQANRLIQQGAKELPGSQQPVVIARNR